VDHASAEETPHEDGDASTEQVAAQPMISDDHHHIQDAQHPLELEVKQENVEERHMEGVDEPRRFPTRKRRPETFYRFRGVIRRL
jgi:hypothetical protein